MWNARLRATRDWFVSSLVLDIKLQNGRIKIIWRRIIACHNFSLQSEKQRFKMDQFLALIYPKTFMRNRNQSFVSSSSDVMEFDSKEEEEQRPSVSVSRFGEISVFSGPFRRSFLASVFDDMPFSVQFSRIATPWSQACFGNELSISNERLCVKITLREATTKKWNRLPLSHNFKRYESKSNFQLNFFPFHLFYPRLLPVLPVTKSFWVSKFIIL